MTSVLNFVGSLVFVAVSFYCFPLTTIASHVHIVYLGHNNARDPLVTTKSHVHLLSSVFSKEEEAMQAMLYSYRHSFSGFAAIINATQASTLASMEGVVSVFRSKTLNLHTTRSWDFLGLTLGGGSDETNIQKQYGDDVIVGVFDTGVWPESLSFSKVVKIRPIPSGWKGKCVGGDQFNPTLVCNRKLIGARYYLKGYEAEHGPLNTTSEAEYRSPRDRLGHGTHTASTAVGSFVDNVSYFGLGRGIARGGAPRARLAVYKICWSKQLVGVCTEADILAAFDDALSDGVHVISASIGAFPPLRRFFQSSSAIGSFHAMQLGVTVVFSAGNDGPESSLVQNVAPWSICVAATVIDRSFPTKIQLGNNATFMGEGFITQKIRTMRLLDAGRLFFDGSCSLDKWNGRRFATGRIVVCFSNVGEVPSTIAAEAVYSLNASGLIFAEPLTKITPMDDFLPTVHVDLNQGTQILYYIHSSNNPVVQIFPSRTAIGRLPAPSVAYFSSRGPSSAYPEILKPDIAAPGVNILAAWSPKNSPSFLPSIDKRSVNWNFDIGTSMSCPHVSGIVALIKSAHPDWSPAAIKSALMTTAITVDTSSDRILAGGTLKPVDPFDIGAGHVNPLQAINPGLVYDMETRDYVHFLCSIGYNQAQIRSMVLPSQCDISCDGSHSILDLNYPAIVISDLRTSVTVRRTVKNVGPSDEAIYFASVVSPQGVNVNISPHCLVFFEQGEKISFYVTVTPWKQSKGRYDFGEIVWFDGYHYVRIPLAVSVNNAKHGEETATDNSSM